MQPQNKQSNITVQSETIAMEDRSRFLRALGFARDRFEANSETDSDGVILSSNFEDDMELPGASVKSEMARDTGDPVFDLGSGFASSNIAADEIDADFPTMFAEEASFDLSGIDDSVWSAVSSRMTHENFDWRKAEADLELDKEANVKKKVSKILPGH